METPTPTFLLHSFVLKKVAETAANEEEGNHDVVCQLISTSYP
jgi:hypothetical protein